MNRPSIDRLKGAAIGIARRETRRRPSSPAKESLVFLREFLRSPRQVASVIPSSRVLQRRLVESAQIRRARRIVELGSGTGCTTRAILEAMSAHARLLSIEINPCLCAVVERVRDERLIVHRGDAARLAEIVSEHGFDPPDVVISGLPISTMDRHAASRLVESVASALAPRGRFVAYQFSKRIESICSPHLDPETLEKRLVLLNLPPVWVMRWDKTAGAEQLSIH